MKLCGECEDQPADWHCLPCNQIYCSDCFKIYHKKTSKRRHHKPVPANICSICEKRRVALECVQCNKDSCEICFENYHRKPSKMFHETRRYGVRKDLETPPKNLRLPKLMKQRPRSAPLGRKSLKCSVDADTPRDHNADILVDATKRTSGTRRAASIKKRLVSPDMLQSPPFTGNKPARSLSISASRRQRRGSRVPLSAREKKLPPLIRQETGEFQLINHERSQSRLRMKRSFIREFSSSNVRSPDSDRTASPSGGRNRLGLKLILERGSLNDTQTNLLDSRGSRRSRGSCALDSTSTDTPESTRSQGRHRRESSTYAIPGDQDEGTRGRKIVQRLDTLIEDDPPRRNRLGIRLPKCDSVVSPKIIRRNKLGLRLDSDDSPHVGRNRLKLKLNRLDSTESKGSFSIPDVTAKDSHRRGMLGSPSRNGSVDSGGEDDLLCSREIIPNSSNATWKITKGEFRKGRFAINFNGVRKLKNEAQTPLEKTCFEMDQPRTLINPNDMVKLGVLGSGFSASVIKAVNKKNFNIMALKVINVFDKSKRQMLIKELEAFEIAKKEKHIVDYYGAYFSEGATTLALEYMNRGSLETVLKVYGPMKETVIKSICKQSLMGLKFLQTNRMMHRDIKPANMLVNHKGQVKLADFGILGFLPSSGQLSKTMVGTQRYMSPERIQSSGYYYNADIWSLGLVAMEMAKGRFPLDVEPNAGYFAIVGVFAMFWLLPFLVLMTFA
mmetsp:Transcript_14292/g.23325  ORF Transcript_14292/g.23325 Transcript_14292/m.23325 type:complete len:727 (+) Transcript_14292:153-2333(+)